MTTPNEVWDYDLKTRARALAQAPGSPERARSLRLCDAPPACANAPDGETVPISILHRKDIKPDGSAPCLLYGYGAYGLCDAGLVPTGRLSLVDRGFVYAIAHVRGGTDKGWHWYQDGKLAKKPNTFTDFIAAAEYLRGAGYARAQIVAHGGSAGGMLMGAIANMRPDLFGGIIAEVPFVDVLNTMLDDTLPLTPPEWQEWGNPITDAQAFRTMLGYSPYDNVRAQALSGDPGARRADRSARDLLGAGQMGREAARAQHRRQADRAAAPTWMRATAARPAASTG